MRRNRSPYPTNPFRAQIWLTSPLASGAWHFSLLLGVVADVSSEGLRLRRPSWRCHLTDFIPDRGAGMGIFLGGVFVFAGQGSRPIQSPKHRDTYASNSLATSYGIFQTPLPRKSTD